jgi:hypothetical protein
MAFGAATLRRLSICGVTPPIKNTLSRVRFQVGLLDRLDSYRRLAPEFRALLPDMTSHTRGCDEQRAERDEKYNK